MSKSHISVVITINGKTTTVAAMPHAYEATEKSGNQVRNGFFYGGKHVFDMKTESDKALVSIEGHDHLAVATRSKSSGNLNFHVGGKVTIDAVEYQVGMNITAVKSAGVAVSGLTNFQVGVNITPVFRAEKTGKGTKKPATKKQPVPAKQDAKPTTQPVPQESPIDQLNRLLASILGKN